MKKIVINKGKKKKMALRKKPNQPRKTKGSRYA